MTTIKELTAQVLKFRNDRDWKQFHTVKDMFLSLGLEISELGEHFQWKTDEEIAGLEKEPLGEELADILYWILLLSNDLEVDLEKAFNDKMKKNEEKYPVEKAQGKKQKYSVL